MCADQFRSAAIPAGGIAPTTRLASSQLVEKPGRRPSGMRRSAATSPASAAVLAAVEPQSASRWIEPCRNARPRSTSRPQFLVMGPREAERLTGLAVGIVATALVPFVSLDRFIFFPDRNVPPPPPGVLERWFTTADGVRLHAWHAVAPDRAPRSSGRTATRQHRRPRPGPGGARCRGLGVLAYDYRGYGRSVGTPSQVGSFATSRQRMTAWRFPVHASLCSASRWVARCRSTWPWWTLRRRRRRVDLHDDA